MVKGEGWTFVSNSPTGGSLYTSPAGLDEVAGGANKCLDGEVVGGQADPNAIKVPEGARQGAGVTGGEVHVRDNSGARQQAQLQRSGRSIPISSRNTSCCLVVKSVLRSARR